MASVGYRALGGSRLAFRHCECLAERRPWGKSNVARVLMSSWSSPPTAWDLSLAVNVSGCTDSRVSYSDTASACVFPFVSTYSDV